jgi:hypothetical protein
MTWKRKKAASVAASFYQRLVFIDRLRGVA